PENLELDAPQRLLVALAEVAALLVERAHARVVLPERIDPDQLLPDLQVAEIGVAERARVRLGAPRRVTAREQLGISRVRVDHPAARRVEEVGEHEPPL